jgi:hypothetical protein
VGGVVSPLYTEGDINKGGWGEDASRNQIVLILLIMKLSVGREGERGNKISLEKWKAS